DHSARIWRVAGRPGTGGTSHIRACGCWRALGCHGGAGYRAGHTRRGAGQALPEVCASAALADDGGAGPRAGPVDLRGICTRDGWGDLGGERAGAGRAILVLPASGVAQCAVVMAAAAFIFS